MNDDLTYIDGRSLPEGSAILAMHGRCEALNLAFNTLDRAYSRAGSPKTGDGFRYERTMKRILQEEDVLRVAILMSPPQDATDMMVVLYHASNLYDMTRGDTGRSARPGELEAVAVALDQLFNYLACTVPQDHERLGAAFQGSANLSFHNGKLLAGETDGQELDDPSDEWPQALAAYREARAVTEASDSEEATDKAADVQTAALKTLLAIPAPDNEAFTVKLQIIDDEGFHEAKEVWPQILNDARRLGPA